MTGTIPQRSNAVTDTGVGKRRPKTALISAIALTARRIWRGKKIAIELARSAKVDPRTCERWLSLRTGISADALIALLRDDDGIEFLDEALGPVKPKWWPALKRSAQYEELWKRQEEQRALVGAAAT